MNYSKQCSRWRFPQRLSIDPNLSWSVTISLSECKDIFVGVTHGVSGIPSIYAGMQFSTADLRCGNGVVSCHLRILPRSDSNSPALCTRIASDLSQARPKYVFVPYRELAYVTWTTHRIVLVLLSDPSGVPVLLTRFHIQVDHF
jgi:hypothetical protein